MNKLSILHLNTKNWLEGISKKMSIATRRKQSHFQFRCQKLLSTGVNSILIPGLGDLSSAVSLCHMDKKVGYIQTPQKPRHLKRLMCCQFLEMLII